MTAFARARNSSIDEVAATAGYNLGVVLGKLGRSEQEIEVYDQVLARFTDAPALREVVARALVNKGVRLGVLGRSGQEIEVYDQVLARFTDAPKPALREP